jgi:hypothetical protein
VAEVELMPPARALSSDPGRTVDRPIDVGGFGFPSPFRGFVGG